MKPLRPTCSSVVSRIAHQACQGAPVSSLPQPWWDHLDPDFHARPEGFELPARRDRTVVAACAALDSAIRTAAAVTVGTFAVPVGYNPWRLAKDLEDEDLYVPAALARDPSLFFQPPPRKVPVRIDRPAERHFHPDDGLCEDVSFESPFRPVNPRLTEPYLRNRRNRVAQGRYWRHHDGPRPTVIALHGYYADAYWLNERMFDIRGLYALGCDVLLVTLPFHGARQGLGSPFSGHGFFAGGAARINEAFAQAVHDVREMMNYLEDARGVRKLGVTGISLGGYTAALLSAIDDRLHFALPTVPVASIADLLLEWPPVAQMMLTIFRTSQVSLSDARRLMAVHCPLSYTPLLPRDRLMVIGGVGDRLAPPKHSRLLWEHWGRCRLHWFPGSHILHLDKGDYLFEIERFLRDIGFIDDHVRPSRMPPEVVP